ncbi:MAG: DoxX family protein [Pedobacter sp.]|nr:MAG: DoxX family protein [Pedobacter sp.]
MHMFQKIEQWGNAHSIKWLAFIRILLGLIIFFKGYTLISNPEQLQTLMYKDSWFDFTGVMGSLALHLVAFAHLVGGIMICIGLMTRFAVVIQIPILICAILFVNIGAGFSMLNSELWLSIIVLALLCLFWVMGAGAYSVDASWKKKPIEVYHIET